MSVFWIIDMIFAQYSFLIMRSIENLELSI